MDCVNVFMYINLPVFVNDAEPKTEDWNWTDFFLPNPNDMILKC
jgi:hypothetical protein